MMDESPWIDEFEAAWQQRRWADVDRILRDPKLPIDDAAELAMIDLEYRWQYPLSEEASRQAAVQNSPQVEDYCRLRPALAEDPQRLLELISEEYRVRLKWDHPPTPEDLSTRFEAFPCQAIEKMICRVEQEVPHLWLAVVRGDTELARLRFHRPLEIGRQSIGQPPPFDEVLADGNRKLVIAVIDNLQVSRRQLRISRCSVGARLENLSSQVAVQTGFRTRLMPGETVELAVPLTLTIGDLRFCLSC
ncbi:hypothetical protein [Rosistilla oblonga]|uniref:hypothetical protein n=1 Tax=Rosistilla oblonga TaxID=2527990 RepID=UPI003A975EA9